MQPTNACQKPRIKDLANQELASLYLDGLIKNGRKPVWLSESRSNVWERIKNGKHDKNNQKNRMDKLELADVVFRRFIHDLSRGEANIPLYIQDGHDVDLIWRLASENSKDGK